MKEQTRRFRGDSSMAYARAVLWLVRLSRRTSLEFSFGPLDVEAMYRNGITVVGPDVDRWADDFLAGVPGLHRADE